VLTGGAVVSKQKAVQIAWGEPSFIVLLHANEHHSNNKRKVNFEL